MPVEDHPVHPSVIKTTTHPGCYNRPPFHFAYQCQDGWTADGRRNMIWVPNRFNPNCQPAKECYAECATCNHL